MKSRPGKSFCPSRAGQRLAGRRTAPVLYAYAGINLFLIKILRNSCVANRSDSASSIASRPMISPISRALTSEPKVKAQNGVRPSATLQRIECMYCLPEAYLWKITNRFLSVQTLMSEQHLHISHHEKYEQCSICRVLF